MKSYIQYIILAIAVVACSPKIDTKISLNKVGPITAETTVNQLNVLFKSDSIVSRLSEGDLGDINAYVLDNDTHLIYNTKGELSLSITPVNPLDSLSKIKSVTVFDKRYKTAKDIHVGSVFSELNMSHTIQKLEASFHLVTVFVSDINGTITLDKQTVGLKAFQLGEINKNQVPDSVPFTSFTIWFSEE
ncbi:hypothetical protein N9901_02570 [Flavobacteriaceae bacterium]|nr:hypothetical protein [Flavobacteriaceae bacterium]